MLRLSGVSVRYGATTALDQIDLEVGPAERLAVLGPSGSGKSTLLRAIAGLEPLVAGRIEWAGEDLASVPTHKRSFGLMFQDYALFPHRDVAGNVAFGLEMSDVPVAERERRAHEVLELVGLRGYGRRRPDQLSGGEQQRVALARALAPTPRLLMLDEPLGALDRALRARLLDDLAALFHDLGLPIVYVTHDQEEALAVGERVCVLNAGRLETVLPAQTLWREPPNEFVARFLGLTNIVPLELNSEGNAAVTPWGELPLANEPPTNATKLLIRPEALELASQGPIGGLVVACTFRGDHTSLLVRPQEADEPILEAHVRSGDVPETGQPVRLAADPRAVRFLP